MFVNRSARPEEVTYGGKVRGESEMKYKDQPGSRIKHVYEVYNNGPWHVSGLEVHVDWPFQVANNKPLGKWLLYLDEEPTADGKRTSSNFTLSLFLFVFSSFSFLYETEYSRKIA